MSKLVCKNCKSVAVGYEDYCGGTSYYRCKTCGQRGDKDKFTPLTVFQKITQSPEVLAEKLVYLKELIFPDEIWESTLLFRSRFYSKEEAIAATVAKLKEAAE